MKFIRTVTSITCLDRCAYYVSHQVSYCLLGLQLPRLGHTQKLKVLTLVAFDEWIRALAHIVTRALGWDAVGLSTKPAMRILATSC